MTDGSRLSVEQMRLLLARGLGAYAVLVPDGAFTVVEASDSYLLATGQLRERLVGRSIFDAFPEKPGGSAVTLRASLERVVATQAPEAITLGQHGRALNTPVRAPDGSLICIVHRIDDIAAAIEVREAEAARRESEERFRTLADNIAPFAWMAEPNGWIFWYNKRWFEHTGTTLDEMQGWGWRAVLHPDHLDRVAETSSRSLETGEPWEDVFPLRGKDGNYRWYLSRAQPIRDADGRIVRWFGTNTDITELRQAEEALRDADRRKDEFLAMLAHELRNPLAAIHNVMELLGQAPEGAPTGRYFDILRRQAGTLSGLVDDLLDVSRITRGLIELELQRVDLVAVVDRALESVQGLMDEKGHEVTVTLPRRPVCVDGDPVRLEQILINLLTNAAKYTDPGGCIQVILETGGDRARVRVCDSGIGIAPELCERIFDLFAQAERGLARSEGGLGIGLTLVKRLVERHGGTIEARSDGPGRGAEFALSLPLAAEGGIESGGGQAAAVAVPKARRILLVEDSADVADTLALLLESSGHCVLVARDGLQALARAAAFAPDVVLLDIGLPGMDGFEVARRLRADPATRHVILAALTGYGQPRDRERVMAAGFDSHFVKPISIDALDAFIADIAGQAMRRS